MFRILLLIVLVIGHLATPTHALNTQCQEFTRPDDNGTPINWSADESFITSSSEELETKLHMWEVTEGKYVGTADVRDIPLEWQNQWIYKQNAVWSSDGSMLALVEQESLNLYKENKLIRTIPKKSVSALWSHDSSIIATIESFTKASIDFWDSKTGNLLHTFNGVAWENFVWHPTKNYFAILRDSSLDKSTEVLVVNAYDGEVIASQKILDKINSHFLLWSPDGTYFLVHDYHQPVEYLWDWEHRLLMKIAPPDFASGDWGEQGIIAIDTIDLKTAFLWDPLDETKTEIISLQSYGGVPFVKWSPLENYLVFWNQSNKIILCDSIKEVDKSIFTSSFSL